MLCSAIGPFGELNTDIVESNAPVCMVAWLIGIDAVVITELCRAETTSACIFVLFAAGRLSLRRTDFVLTDNFKLFNGNTRLCHGASSNALSLVAVARARF